MNILLTGITGTIGTAFTDLLKDKHTISGVDRNERAVAGFSYNVPIVVNDFDEVSLKDIDLVIHLAAMKHVDLCEDNSNSCVMNNVIRTYNLFKKAHEAGTDVLFMSTDKAVEPISTYGYTKALGESMAKDYGFAFVRSGNVVASSGSVLEVWDKAIKDNQPIRITDLNMKRYFISPENLVKRIWELYQAGEREIIPEMDKHVTLDDLLKEKLAEHGLEDYPIEIIGLRKGEKLEEKLQW